MVIEKADNTTIRINVDDIKQIYFEEKQQSTSTDISQEGSYQVKEPYTPATIQIQFETEREIPNSIFGEDDVNSVTIEKHIGYGLLGLAYDYQQYGKPSKLAIFFHGSGGYYNHNSTDFQSSMKPYIDFMRKSGYTVFAPYAWDESTDYHAFATPYSIGNFIKAVKYVIDKYNVEDDGLYIWGRSAGGSGVLTFAFNCGMKVKAIALHHPLIGSVVWEHNVSSVGDNMVKKYIFDNDANYSWTEQYLTDNFHKIAPFENMFNGLIDSNVSIADKVNFLCGNFSTEDWKSYVRSLPFPCKIWAAADDRNVPYRNILIFHQQVINAGDYCELSQLPSNYTDDFITTANPHHFVDTSGPRSTVITKLGYEVEISNGYIETVEWFDRF